MPQQATLFSSPAGALTVLTVVHAVPFRASGDAQYKDVIVPVRKFHLVQAAKDTKLSFPTGQRAGAGAVLIWPVLAKNRIVGVKLCLLLNKSKRFIKSLDQFLGGFLFLINDGENRNCDAEITLINPNSCRLNSHMKGKRT